MTDTSRHPDEGRRRSTVKLLIVDDNSQKRTMTRFYLRDIFDEIRECAGGEKTLETVAEFMPTWIVMEVYLKETDGFALIRRISVANRQTRIIVLTNRTDDQTRGASLAAGAFAFFGADDLMALASLLKSTET